ncbi:MAG: biotin/lipoyl-binding protein [Dehalococcoidia bacterium]|nr:biotin/lipoyl-binding protein [Dehalococcoidia bacterium]
MKSNTGSPKSVIFAVVSLAALLLLAAGCVTRAAGAATPQATVATVQRGNIPLDITTAGNLKYSVTAEPAFEMSGYVAEVLVEEGQMVKKGQVLARLDTSAYEDQLRSLETALLNAQRTLFSRETAVLQAKVNLKNAEVALEQGQRAHLFLGPERLRGGRPHPDRDQDDAGGAGQAEPGIGHHRR